MGQNNNIIISPNPSNGSFTIVLSDKNESYQSIRITDFNGKLLYENKENIKEQISVQLDIENGMYLLILENENSRVIRKIIIQK